MKIDDNRVHNYLLFEDLEPGEIFTSSGYYYMKTRDITDQNTGVLFNAVELLDGVFAQFADEEEVEEVKGKLVLE